MSREKKFVIDNGSGLCKAGFAGEEVPKVVLPSFIGKPKSKSQELGDKKDFVGNEVISKRGLLNISYPMENGNIINFDDMEKIWNYLLNYDLQLESKEYSLLLTETPFNTKSNREKMTQVMYESFSFYALFIGMEPKLSLFSSGRTNGLVVDIGDRISYFTPIFDGEIIEKGVSFVDIGGQDLTDYLSRILYEKGNVFKSSERNLVNYMKERLCYITDDYEKSIKNHKDEISYELPDGKVITLGDELFRCPEALFSPYSLGKELDGIAETTNLSIQKAGIENRVDMIENILLSGGSTKFQGLKERLEKELHILSPKTSRIKVIAPENRQYSVFIGGSMLSSLSSFQYNHTREEYEEYGPQLHKKFNF